MNLISLGFVLFFGVAFCLYYLLGRCAPKWQWLGLVAANLGFYYFAAGLRWIWLIVLMAFVAWAAALLMGRFAQAARAERKATRDRAERKAIKAQLLKRKRVVLVLALLALFGVLGYFKYWNTVLFNLGMAESSSSLGIALPLGISFFSFQSLGYVIDVYNDKLKPEANFARYFAFASYFPQLLQGPINRYAELAPQLFAPHRMSWHGFQRGALRVGLGLVKKIVIANMLASNVGVLLAHMGDPIPGAVALLGIVLYSIQMYGDFSGGIDVVDGFSEMLGIRMAQNFRQPYLSTSLSDFWRRWHMSLGAFMKDYVFYPLALTRPMQRFGKWGQAHLGRHLGRTLPACVANIIVFVLVGLWHGAELHYLVWGFVNGAIIAISDLLIPLFTSLRERFGLSLEQRPYYILSVLRTFLIVNFSRYLDAISSVAVGVTAIKSTFFNFVPAAPVPEVLASLGVSFPWLFGLSPVVLLGFIFVMLVDVLEEGGTDVREAILSWGHVRRLLFYMALVLLIFCALPRTLTGGVSFMYAHL